MRFVNDLVIEGELPPDVEQTAEEALGYVREKVEEARQAALADHTSADLVREAMKRARSRAVNAKSKIWSDVGKVLRKIMHDKCWYCETYETRSDLPIDHFRPKNRVAECKEHEGYWWLAFDWRNYRFSCTFCNSRRNFEESSGGKQDQFPLVNPEGRAWNPEDDLGKEKPFLLDPCDPDDPKLLTFLENGFVSEAFSDKERVEYKRAACSIISYHLNHNKAVKERKQCAVLIKRKIERIERLESEEPITDVVRGEIKEIKKEIFLMIHPRAPYCTASTIYLRGHSAIPWVDQLLQRGPFL